MSLTNANFPDTHQSLVYLAGERTGPEAGAAMEKLSALYWPPLYAFLRRRGETPVDPQDHVQGLLPVSWSGASSTMLMPGVVASERFSGRRCGISC